MTATGSINGIGVTWSDAPIQGTPYNASGVEVFREHQGGSHAGPGNQSLTLTGVITGEGHEAAAKNLHRLTRLLPFSLVYHPNGVFQDEQWAWMTVTGVSLNRGVGHTTVTVNGEYAGSPWTSDVAVAVTSRAVPNVYLERHCTAIHIPESSVQVAGGGTLDAGRSVLQSPTDFSSHDAGYAPGDTHRNGFNPVRYRVTTAPEQWLQDVVHVLDASGRVHGSGEALGSRSVVSIGAVLSFAAGDATLDNPLGTEAVSWTRGAGFNEVSHGGVGSPATWWRHVLELGNGDLVTVEDTGLTTYYPAGDTWQVTTASPATRALASGVFYHEVHPDTYIVSDSDFAVDASGNVTDYEAGARFAFIFTAAAAPNDALREAYADRVVDWFLIQRGVA